MTNLNRLAAAVAALVALAGAVFAQDLPQLRAALLKTGTVNWEIATIKANGFDTANGFDLLVQDYADNAATRIALEGGEADVVVADWIWVAMMRAEGKDFVFLPYSRAVGSLVVRDDSGIASLSDLKGKKIGVAGGPLDKSWLILRAYAEKQHGMNLAAETEQVFGAPPLIFKAGLDGETAGAVNFWHFLAKMKAKGMHDLVTVTEAATALGLDPDTPLLGYVLKDDYVAAHPEVAQGLARASAAAKEKLRTDDTAWDAIRPMMNAEDDAEFAALVEGYRAGIPSGAPVDEAAADRFLRLMAELGGEELVGKATTLPAGVFLKLD
ncbi:MAG: ABC transporter substrate-binding protein [Rhodobacteraceae bacterium]|jgi:NitT/TauT family transport system substrate-binding protein|uniref:ABC transporter substrate-binding protein n=1 Tax=Albidovulum sp. TaxID=1872424 RepID=UPI00265AE840|nr:ABC transporter substrate-binding protein [uncultured Defluviimonas sp.]MCC0070418.1 ABC transporter substrate-binding protein [Paracoccaceae bacterium]